ncbi:Uncharacterised protein [uncultured archaeon]|nr:Uncharacterised protein [uncultured archaeon]
MESLGKAMTAIVYLRLIVEGRASEHRGSQPKPRMVGWRLIKIALSNTGER